MSDPAAERRPWFDWTDEEIVKAVREMLDNNGHCPYVRVRMHDYNEGCDCCQELDRHDGPHRSHGEIEPGNQRFWELPEVRLTP